MPLRSVALCLAVCTFLLVVLEGDSIRRSGERMEDGVAKSVVVAVGAPTGWVADRLPFADAGEEVTAAISPGGDGGDAGAGFDQPTARGGVPPVGPEAFAPETLGERPAQPRALRRVLATGDSLVMPLDGELARTLIDRGVRTTRDAHVGTGITKAELTDWGKLSAAQTADERPDAVVMWLGANEGFPMGDLDCCGAAYAAEYATRARRMMDTYRQGGRARVYWLTLPIPRDPDQARVARTVNAAIRVAAEAYRAHVRVLDMTALFTPGGRYRDAMEVDGRERIVRESDGIHVNATGARLATDAVVAALERDFALGE